MTTERSRAATSAFLTHLTKTHDTLAAILFQATVRAVNPFGAIHAFPQLRESQLVACFSGIDLAELPALAGRHGEYGLALSTRWMQAQGARPVSYLPRDTPFQQKYFELVKQSAYRGTFNKADALWQRTPFIDYPRIAPEGGTPSKYDWRWEREWRVRGDLTIDSPSRVEFLVAPETSHDALRHQWEWELGGQTTGSTPAMIDARWPLPLIHAAIRRGSTPIVDELADLESDLDDLTDTAPQPAINLPDDGPPADQSLPAWEAWLMRVQDDGPTHLLGESEN